MIRLLAIVCLAQFAVLGQARADVSGTIIDQVWDSSDSPVLVTGDLTVAGLTINPGVLVEFAGNYRVTVNGILRVHGSEQEPVVLRPAAGNTAGWQGIYFEDMQAGSFFEWCRLEGATTSAVHLVRSNPSFKHCTFSGNHGAYGGAIRAVLTDQDLSVADCQFEGNSADTAGGAIHATLETGTLRVSDTTFSGNRANPGFAKRNTSGGAVAVSGNSHFIRSTFTDNQANAYTIYARYGIRAFGGALWSADGQCEVTACEFRDNACRMTAHSYTPDTSYPYGGAVFLSSGSLLLQNSIVAGSSLSAQRRNARHGSALYVGSTATASIVNSTLADNTGAPAIYASPGGLDLLNSIVFFNNASGTQISGAPTAAYSTIQGAATAGIRGQGVVETNPVLDADYRILVGSPAIDAGHPDAAYYDTFPPGLGTARNDMGAFGGPQAHHWTDDTSPPLPKCEGLTATIVGTDHDDVIRGTPGDDVIVSLRGDDVVYGRGGNDVICAGPGNDMVNGGRGNDAIYGQDGFDVLRGGAGNDLLNGGPGRDYLFGGNGADKLLGMGETDYLAGEGGDDTLDGGDGASDVCDGGSAVGGNTFSATCETKLP